MVGDEQPTRSPVLQSSSGRRAPLQRPFSGLVGSLAWLTGKERPICLQKVDAAKKKKSLQKVLIC